MAEEIEIKTEEVNELLTSVPKWIIRWGDSIIFLIMLLVLTLSVFIKYPDTLSAKTIITTTNPPVTLVAKTNGKIIELKVKNNQIVKKGDVLLIIESPANYKDVYKTDSMLDSLSLNIRTKQKLPVILYDSLGLGELTTAFITFLKSYSDFKLQSEINPQEKEIEIINEELEEYHQLQNKYENQETIFKDEFLLVEKDYYRYSSLLQSASISTKEFEDKKREYLSSKRNYETVKINNINNKLNINNLEKNKLQLQMLAYQENEKMRTTLEQSIQNLKSQIESWEQVFVIKSPLDGRISLFNFWTVNQNLKLNDNILSIVPVQKQKVIAKLFLSAQNSGKLKTGQTVNIKLNNYLYQEYGVLKGTIKNISAMPQDGLYAIEVSLPDQLVTSYHKQLEYKQEMQGYADIITEELSIFDRIFYQFRKIVNR